MEKNKSGQMDEEQTIKWSEAKIKASHLNQEFSKNYSN